MTTLRADAERNRAQLVAAARAVFAERGLDAPLDEIARRAAVGNATLYRRFPTRCHLLGAVFADTMREVVAATDAALATADPWTAFTGHLRFLCGLQAADRALADLLTTAMAGSAELEALRARAYAGLVTLVDRAQAAGALRADFRHEDVVLLLMANAGLLERTCEAAPGAWDRHLSLVLDGLRAEAATPAAPTPGPQRVQRAMKARAERLGCA
jgi:AcrR family transcriptional regulator